MKYDARDDYEESCNLATRINRVKIGGDSFLDGKVTLHRGDCLDVLPLLADNSVDSVVSDPPYHLGFMGKQWDGGGIAFDPLTWELVHRVLKPGGHLLAFSSTRTYHRMACAIEDAGFEIRDQIGWCYGSGFPKSHDVSKGIDRMAGAEREIVGNYGRGFRAANSGIEGWRREAHKTHGNITAPATEAAIQWQGWGTALKPAWEPICLARKPLSESSIAANVLRHGTGGINVDGCRVEGIKPQVTQGINSNATSFNVAKERRTSGDPHEGRWPANLIHDGSEEVLAGFPDRDGAASNGRKGENGVGNWGHGAMPQEPGYSDSGSAARFFYTAKADSNDRLGSKHPTVKPLDLMQYLVRLVCPKGGVVLDPFSGTGTTGEAAWREGMHSILIEREAEYQADIIKRMGLCLAGPDQRRAASTKQESAESLPLFMDVSSAVMGNRS